MQGSEDTIKRQAEQLINSFVDTRWETERDGKSLISEADTEVLAKADKLTHQYNGYFGELQSRNAFREFVADELSERTNR